jgi:hypothetical protein
MTRLNKFVWCNVQIIFNFRHELMMGSCMTTLNQINVGVERLLEVNSNILIVHLGRMGQTNPYTGSLEARV